MSEVIARPATGATKAPAREKAAPIATQKPTRPVLRPDDSGTLVQQALRVLEFVLVDASEIAGGCLIQGAEAVAINAQNIAYAISNPDEVDDAPPLLEGLGQINHHLIALLGLLDTAHGKQVPGAICLSALVDFAAQYSGRLRSALDRLPHSLEELRALTATAGARPLCGRPHSPDERAPMTNTLQNISTTFQAVANALDSAARTGEPHDWSGDSDRLLRIGAYLARRSMNTGLEAKDVSRCAHDIAALVRAARLVPGDTESQERAAFLEAAAAPLAWLTEDRVENVFNPGAPRPPAPNATATEDVLPEKTGVEALLNTVCGKLRQACAVVRSVLQVSDYGTHYHGLLSLALDGAERAQDRLVKEEFSAGLADSVYLDLFPVVHCMHGALALAATEDTGIFIGSMTEATQLMDGAQNALDSVMVEQALQAEQKTAGGAGA